MTRFDAVRKILKTSIHNSSTDHIAGFSVRPGNHSLPGAQVVPGGINFTITSKGATSCELLLFNRKQDIPYAVLKIPEAYRIGSVYSIFVAGLVPENFEYA